MAERNLAPWSAGGGLTRRGGGGRAASPFRSILDRFFDDWFDDLSLQPFPLAGGGLTNFDIPRIDVIDDDKEVRIMAELPGMGKEDIEIILARDHLTIRGEKREERDENQGNYYRRERVFGTFVRDIPLPYEVKADEVTAEFKNGILEIKLPKSPQAMEETKKIPIQGTTQEGQKESQKEGKEGREGQRQARESQKEGRQSQATEAGKAGAA
jgi:HSP20 family protein